MKTKQQQSIFKISLLSISVLLMSAPIISAALPSMIDSFPSQSKSAVETLLTIPNVGIILALLFSPFCIRMIGKKKTVLVGLVIALISGLLPALISNYTLILGARFIFGIGIGLFNSLAVSLLAEFYEGDELSTMMGFQSMAGSLGSAGLSFFISYLVTLGWQQTFWAYLIILPVLFLFGFFVQIPESQHTQTTAEVQTEKISVNLPIVGLSVLIFFLFSFFMASVIKLPEFIIHNNIGSASSVSIITGLSTLVGIPVGMFYGKIHQLLKQQVLPIGLFISAIGFFIVSQSSNLPILLIGVGFSGVGFGLAVPFIYTWTALVADKRAINFAYTCLIIATNIGVFFSPVLLNTLGKLFGNTSADFSLFMAALGFLCMSLIMSIKLIFKKK
ncbi:MFS transporter [Vagococcus sp. BWB3-3]|uniref:MFS transporter n=1 Tax=Vagococcus allomyrinae TaxID=2794353 RepID=A0A940P7K2_9ENTE|nr:MFS transporter [Vagococcus allomyrinae]MBP1039520.1 MFS transporter [Vagococcus allomyrinae]